VKAVAPKRSVGGPDETSIRATARQASGRIEDFVNKNLIPILVWVVLIGAAFALAWWKGYIVQIRNYWNSMVDELHKCSWPTWEELKGSSVVVTLSIALLGLFCYGVDTIFYYLVRWISI
jgi:preprotein translocase subunit SecE